MLSPAPQPGRVATRCGESLLLARAARGGGRLPARWLPPGRWRGGQGTGCVSHGAPCRAQCCPPALLSVEVASRPESQPGGRLACWCGCSASASAAESSLGPRAQRTGLPGARAPVGSSQTRPRPWHAGVFPGAPRGQESLDCSVPTWEGPFRLCWAMRATAPTLLQAGPRTGLPAGNTGHLTRWLFGATFLG